MQYNQMVRVWLNQQVRIEKDRAEALENLRHIDESEMRVNEHLGDLIGAML